MIHSTGIAERLAFGRPVDPVVDDTPVRVAQRPATALIGRILMAAIFLTGGFAKLTNTEETVGYMTSMGIPAPETLAIVAGLAEIAGALGLIFGCLTRLAALGLILYLIPTTLIFHAFWTLEGAEQKMQMINFMKNLAIMGGLATLFAHGPSRYSIDKKIRDPIQP